MRADHGQAAPPSTAGYGPAQQRTRGAGARLLAELRDLADGYGTLVAHRQRPWASITFNGERHELSLRFDGAAAAAAAERLIAEVGEHEFVIPGQLVADVAVVEVDHSLVPEPLVLVRLDVLLLEEG